MRKILNLSRSVVFFIHVVHFLSSSRSLFPCARWDGVIVNHLQGGLPISSQNAVSKSSKCHPFQVHQVTRVGI
ncbi:hypothetical protein EDD16DRAFT_1556653 [Pisolithus croceorrhizus]|nr:hypothetical protein EDD16DRAFT_1556653 [Pisolithus croceorrhizus]